MQCKRQRNGKSQNHDDLCNDSSLYELHLHLKIWAMLIARSIIFSKNFLLNHRKFCISKCSPAGPSICEKYRTRDPSIFRAPTVTIADINEKKKPSYQNFKSPTTWTVPVSLHFRTNLFNPLFLWSETSIQHVQCGLCEWPQKLMITSQHSFTWNGLVHLMDHGLAYSLGTRLPSLPNF